MRRHISALFMVLIAASAARSAAAPTETILKIGGVYCISQAAIEEHLKATADADTDRVRDILSVRKICDYAQAPVSVTVLPSPPTAKWSKVRVPNVDGPWRKGSKVTLPKDLIVWVRANSIQ